ncbi:MAG: ABC transporter ATP-binding protein [Flavobacteriales bacterium]|nr:ABC transporter ATP-binding protein [Flavobacteriales bacterium]
MEPALEVISLKKRFGPIQAVDGVTFSVKAGEICGFLGPNGAGKSTTLRALLTLITPDAGTLHIFGLDVFRARARALARVGALIERADFYKYLTALETLNVLSSYHRLRPDKTRFMELLRLVGLEERAHSRVKTFSQGMKQRLGIAQALLHDPDVLILDEPTNGLDPSGMVEMRLLIRRLCREFGKTILLSSHLLNEVEMLADTVVIIHKGRIQAQGPLSEMGDRNNCLLIVRWEPAPSALLEAFAQSLLPQRVKNLKSDGAEFQIPEKDVPELLSALLGLGFRVVEVQRRHTLENLFLKVTGEAHVANNQS